MHIGVNSELSFNKFICSYNLTYMTAIAIIIKGPYFVSEDYDLENVCFVNVHHHQVSIVIPCST